MNLYQVKNGQVVRFVLAHNLLCAVNAAIDAKPELGHPDGAWLAASGDALVIAHGDVDAVHEERVKH
jgi:hypothetical protein